MKVINRFEGIYRFLSNFWVSEIEYRGYKWPSTEHAYQAMKTTDSSIQELIRNCKTPGHAKRLGKTLKLRENWDSVKNDIMYDLLKEKFKDPALAMMLVNTEDAILIECNTWHDNYWGSCYCLTCGNHGDNILGKLLMQVRDELRS